MGGSTCIITVLLLMTMFLQNGSLRVIGGSDVEENAGREQLLVGFRERELGSICCFSVFSLQIPTGGGVGFPHLPLPGPSSALTTPLKA